jgi:predicted type IV restriction endonuclease
MSPSTVPKPISSLSLQDLREKTGLTRDRTNPFFDHWLDHSTELSPYEQQALVRLQRNYENILETSPLEEVVKLVVVAPLLDLAGFYQPPFSIRTEASTRLELTEEQQTFTGSIDVLVVKQRFWILVIESKQSRFDVTSGIPQTLSYMLSQPPNAQAIAIPQRFGMVTNGREVVFLQLHPGQPPTYAQSRAYQVIETDHELTQILQGLKAIAQRLR